MFRRSRKNPTATIKDFTEGDVVPNAVAADIAGRDFATIDNGDGTYDVTLGGDHFAGPVVAAGGVWSTTAGRPDITFVSRFVPLHDTYEEAIEAAIAEAAEKPGGVVDFEGVHYVTTGSVTVDSAGVTLANGGVVPTGEFPTLWVLADDVTVRDMTFSRSDEADPLATLDMRACVVVNAERFTSIDCRYLAANMACVYLANGNADGAVIRGGEMTGAAGRQNACGVYAASGDGGNRDITVQNVHIHDCTDGVLLFDTGDSSVSGNRIEHLRKLPTITLTGWTNVSGNIWRQRTATGSNPGVDGPASDRDDGNTTVVRVNGVGISATYTTTPTSNQAGIGQGGYVYINLGGTDPNTVTVTSGIVSGYAVTVYVTGSDGSKEHYACYNSVADNRIQDVDGFGIYFQLGYVAGAVGNQAVANRLKNVCLEGVQTATLPFAGIGVNGGNDTLIQGGIIDGVGSTGKPAPGVDIIPSPTGGNAEPSGRIVGLTVRNGTSSGYLIRSANWLISACRAYNNAAEGFRVWSNVSGGVVDNVELANCRAVGNATNGLIFDGSGVGVSYISGRVVGGTYVNNGHRGVGFYSDNSNQTVRDVAAIGVHAHGNGAATFHAQIHVRGACRRALVDGCHLTSTSTGATGLSIDALALEPAVGTNHYSLTIPENFGAPVRDSSRGGQRWRGSGTPEGVVAAMVGATYQRSDGASATTLYVKESGTGATGWVPHAGLLARVNPQTGTSYTLALSDSGGVVELNNASAVTLTVPLNSTVTFPIGTVVELHQYGAGQVTVTPESVTIIRSVGGARKLVQYGTAWLRKRANNEWELYGDIVT